jgi:hypothetical protein
MNRALSSLEKAALIALYEEVGFSTHAHISIISIQRHFAKELRGFCSDALKGLVKKGYVIKHPTGGSMTYSLTTEGIIVIKLIFGE